MSSHAAQRAARTAEDAVETSPETHHAGGKIGLASGPRPIFSSPRASGDFSPASSAPRGAVRAARPDTSLVPQAVVREGDIASLISLLRFPHKLEAIEESLKLL